MCVILHGLKKKHLKREELIEAMRHNNDGFFLAALREGGARQTFRTLDEQAALKFFDEEIKDDDQVVIHARIPSAGGKNLANVHGWEEDGILFSHNMTLTDLKPMMTKLSWGDRTDSEFFFRKIFIPYYRGLGKDAYKDGKFHPDLQCYVEHFCGSWNKFCFIMPDNKVIRIGPWVNEADRKEGDEIAFWASNTSYKVTTGGGVRRLSDYDDDDGWGMYGGGYGCTGGGGRTRGRHAAGSGNALAPKYTGVTCQSTLGLIPIVKFAVMEWTMLNVVSTRIIGYPATGIGAHLSEMLAYAVPKYFTREGYKIFGKHLPTVHSREGVVKFVQEYAPHLEKELCTEGGKYPNAHCSAWSVEDGWQKFLVLLAASVQALSIDYKFDVEDPTRIATAFQMRVSRKGNPVVERLDPSDVLGHDDMKVEDTYKAFGSLLKEIHDEERRLEEEAAKRDKEDKK